MFRMPTPCFPQKQSWFTTVHAALGRGMDPRAPHVLGRVRADATVDVGEAVVAADGREPPVDGRWGEASCFHPGPVQLHVGSGRCERCQADVASPLEVLAQIGAVRLERPTACSGPGMPRLPAGPRREAEARPATPAASSANIRAWTSSTSSWVDHQHRASCQVSNDVDVDRAAPPGPVGVAEPVRVHAVPCSRSMASWTTSGSPSIPPRCAVSHAYVVFASPLRRSSDNSPPAGRLRRS